MTQKSTLLPASSAQSFGRLTTDFASRAAEVVVPTPHAPSIITIGRASHASANRGVEMSKEVGLIALNAPCRSCQ